MMYQQLEMSLSFFFLVTLVHSALYLNSNCMPPSVCICPIQRGGGRAALSPIQADANGNDEAEDDEDDNVTGGGVIIF